MNFLIAGGLEVMKYELLYYDDRGFTVDIFLEFFNIFLTPGNLQKTE
jgi:hypothetical protein